MYKLRELERNDIPIINSWRSDKKLVEKLGAPFRYINEEVDFKWYEHYMLNRNNAIRCTILNDEDKIIGLISLTDIDRFNQTATFHIMIGDFANRGQGIGYLASNEILRHAFFDMNLNRIELSVLINNEEAISLYDKLGFQKEGVKRKAVYKNGLFTDMVIMAILKENYIEK